MDIESEEPDRAQAMLDIGRATARALADVPEPDELLHDEHGLRR